MITIKANGLDKLLNDLEIKKTKSKIEIKNELVATIYDIQAQAKQLINSQSSNTGNLANSIEVDTSKDSQVSIYSKAEYAAYIEFGTRKYAQQYVATLPSDWQRFASEFKGKKSNSNFYQFVMNLIEWSKKIGGIEPENAYWLAKKILREGIQARPFLYPSVNNNLPKLKIRLKNILK